MCHFRSQRGIKVKSGNGIVEVIQWFPDVIINSKKRVTRNEEQFNEVENLFHSKDHSSHICDKPFSNKKRFVDHIKSHGNAKKFGCTFCNKKYKNTKSLSKHVKHCHVRKQLGFKCDMCRRVYDSKAQLEKHTALAHINKEYICDICGKTFFIKSKLVVHLVSHGNDRPFNCIMCEKKIQEKT